MAGVGRVLLHKVGANTALPTSIVYRGVSRCAYCVSRTVPCGVYHDARGHQCIVPEDVTELYRLCTRVTISDFLLDSTVLYPVSWTVSVSSALDCVQCSGLHEITSALDCVQCSELCPVLWTVSNALDCVQCSELCPVLWTVSSALDCVQCSGLCPVL